ncbi:MAG: LEA type 2 family protein [Nevskiaceae bacterium]|jgi:LEA14-like dessication related protein|nr:LEA type 2 family protein [Nevskiaceae bacterium]
MQPLRTLMLSMLLLLAACSSVTDLKAPDLDVVNVRMLGGDLSGQRLRLTVRVTNPNDRELPVKGIVYQMRVNGAAFATGESERAFTVPALGSTDFDLNMNANIAGTLFRLLGGGGKLDKLDYQLTGKVSLSSGLLRSIPFDKKGSFDLR